MGGGGGLPNGKGGGRGTDRQTGRQAGRQTERQTDKHTFRYSQKGNEWETEKVYKYVDSRGNRQYGAP